MRPPVLANLRFFFEIDQPVLPINHLNKIIEVSPYCISEIHIIKNILFH
jgi:hypothetical protein